MENASKALIMVAGMLIALMIIGALLLMFNNLSNYQQVGTQNTRESQVIDFNNQFETYNRTDVRGSDLYSLLNRVVDYNRRKSTEALGLDEGKSLAYVPMQIQFTIGNIKLFTKDNINRLITQTSYTVNKTSNQFDNIYNEIRNIESAEGKQTIQNLCTGIDKIFYATNKKDAIISFNSAYGEIKYTWDNDLEGQYKKMYDAYNVKVHKYYEYVQFKRARFKCTGTTYNEQTGRITGMNFEFTGKFE